ncbi:hypothetical protein N657DRAFT_619423 [Parathielavia appendiculata]|uniref:Uncharacterized protein n=1 Tax=Parathielavia appendiculata TaxID=2587402 RepID=A0AAN6U0B1_9PEZI|nr:hypothetical protein N657DRAFT_619423 [Parathielavia appendiculata]
MSPPADRPTGPDGIPSFEASFAAGIFPGLSASAKRLRWTLDGPLEAAISVAAGYWIDPTIPDEPYHRADAVDQRHPISRDPYTEPKVSSVTISADLLSDWENNWFEVHRDHVLPGGEEENGKTRIGSLPDFDPEDEDDAWPEVDGEGSGHLLVCCGSERPRKTETKFQLLVTAKGAGPDGFLTVHDFLEQVHPWLMGLKGEILEARAVAFALLEGEDDVPSREELLARDGHMKFFVFGAKDLVIWDEEEWTERMTKRPYIRITRVYVR